MHYSLFFGGLLALSTLTSATPPREFDLTKLHLGPLAAPASKAQVTKHLGQPLAVINPHYECGDFSAEQGGQTFYQLRYRQAVFIGNSREGYELESFNFTSPGPARLAYGEQPLSAATTLAEFKRRFGPLESYPQKDGSVEVIVRQEDATAAFIFRAGRLARYEFHGTGC